MSAMYQLPAVVPNTFTHMDTNLRMYKLPPIQGDVEVQEGRTGDDAELLKLEARQESILNRLEDLQLRVNHLNGQNKGHLEMQTSLEVAIHASPAHPPHSLPLLLNYLMKHTGHKIFTSCYVHSSYMVNLPPQLFEYLPAGNCQERSEADLKIALIWNEVGIDPVSVVGILPNSTVRGEVNMLRFFARLFGICGFDGGNESADQMKEDELLDTLHSSLFWAEEITIDKKSVMKSADGVAKQKLESNKNQQQMSLSDFLVYSALKNLFRAKPTPNVTKFVQHCEKLCQGRRNITSLERQDYVYASIRNAVKSDRDKMGEMADDLAVQLLKADSHWQKEIKLRQLLTKELSQESPCVEISEALDAQNEYEDEIRGKHAVEVNLAHLKLSEQEEARADVCRRKRLKIRRNRKQQNPENSSARNFTNDDFLYQWPKIQCLYCADSAEFKLMSDLNRRFHDSLKFTVTEKLDGSCLAIGSTGFVASRRKLLIRGNATEDQLANTKFGGSNLSSLRSHLLFDVVSLRQCIQRMSRLEEYRLEIIVYGEWINKSGTASSAKDKYAYRQREIMPGDFRAFGLGVYLASENADPFATDRVWMHLSNYMYHFGFRAVQIPQGQHIVPREAPAGRRYFWVAHLNDCLLPVFKINRFDTVPFLGSWPADEVFVENLKHVSPPFGKEGLILNPSITGGAMPVYKWKTSESDSDPSHTEENLDRIRKALTKNDDDDQEIDCWSGTIDALRLANTYVDPRGKAGGPKSAKQALMDSLYKSALTKYPTVEDTLHNSRVSSKKGEMSDEQIVDKLFREIADDMIKDWPANAVEENDWDDIQKLVRNFLRSKRAAIKLTKMTSGKGKIGVGTGKGRTCSSKQQHKAKARRELFL